MSTIDAILRPAILHFLILVIGGILIALLIIARKRADLRFEERRKRIYIKCNPDSLEAITHQRNAWQHLYNELINTDAPKDQIAVCKSQVNRLTIKKVIAQMAQTKDSDLGNSNNPLFSTLSFLSGMGSVINLAGNHFEFNMPSGENADSDALKSDFQKVGDDLNEAIHSQTENQVTERDNLPEKTITFESIKHRIENNILIWIWMFVWIPPVYGYYCKGATISGSDWVVMGISILIWSVCFYRVLRKQ